MANSSRILIAGAGIGGLTAAIALRRAGCEVQVLERASELRPVGAGIILAMNALLGLKSLGVYPPIAAAGAPLQRAQILTRRGRSLGETDLSPLADELGVAAIAYHRAELHQALLAQAGDVVRLGARVVAFDQDPDGVRVTLADGKEIDADALVGADGLHSAVRRAILGELPPRYSGYTSWRGVTDAEGLVKQGFTSESWGSGRRFGIVGLTGGRAYWFAVDNAPEGGRDEADVRGQLLRLFSAWHDPIPALIQRTPPEAIVRTDIHDRDPVVVWGDGRVTLLGDAAHPMTPNMGQGACQAVEDAVVLAEEVLRSPSLATAFRRYETRRQPRTRAVVLQSRRLGEVAQWSNPLARWVRNRVLWALPKEAAVRQLRRFVQTAPVFHGA